MTSLRSLSNLTLLALTACLLFALVAPPAAAAPNQLRLTVDGRPVQDGLDRMLAVGPLVPTRRETVIVVAKNKASQRARLSLRVVDVYSAEHGCLDSERAAGDTTCGTGVRAGEGDDSAYLRLVRIVGTKNSKRIVVRQRPVDTFGGLALTSLRPGEAAVYELRMSVPSTVGGLPQTDDVDFGMVWTLRGLPDAPHRRAGPRRGTAAIGPLLDADLLATAGLTEGGGHVAPASPSHLLWVVGGGLLTLLPWRLRRGPRPRRREPVPRKS